MCDNMKGIYAYYDIEKENIVYVGKDSRIDIDRRHKAHKNPSRYNDQIFNRILQNNPNRYVYKRLYVCPSHLDELDLNGLEMQYIEALNPKFNFTNGGEGVTGYKHSEEIKKKMSKAKKGSSPWNKGKRNIYSKETLKRMSDGRKNISPWNKGKKGVYNEDTLKKMSEGRRGKAKGKHNSQWKDEARVVKRGKTHYGKQQYALKYDGKIIKRSVDYDKLQGIADDINKTRLEVDYD